MFLFFLPKIDSLYVFFQVRDVFQNIINAVALFPGCTDESFLWKSSNLRMCFQQHNFNHGNKWLLGNV